MISYQWSKFVVQANQPGVHIHQLANQPSTPEKHRGQTILQLNLEKKVRFLSMCWALDFLFTFVLACAVVKLFGDLQSVTKAFPLPTPYPSIILSMQCCSAVQATCKKQQTPQLRIEGRGRDVGYFVL